MAFGITKVQLSEWKKKSEEGKISFLTHYWYDPRFPEMKTVTKVACSDRSKLIKWGIRYGLKEEWIHKREFFPHFDLLGSIQEEVMRKEGRVDELNAFLKTPSLK